MTAGDPVVPPGTTYGTSGTSAPGTPGSAANEWAKGYAQGLAAGERESDARAEAAHAKGYEQGQRDARAPHRICYVDPGSSAVVYAVCVCGEQLIGSYGASLSDLLSIHIRKVAAPDPHPGGTNPVAARVGTDGPA